MAIIKPVHPPLDITPCNLLDFLFPEGEPIADDPLWIDADNEDNHLTPKQLVVWVRRVAVGLQWLGVSAGDSVLVFTPDHIFVPVAYLGVVSIGAAFSGASPSFTATELAHQFRVCQPKVFLVHPSLLETASTVIDQCSFPKSYTFLLSDEQNRPEKGFLDWREFMATDLEAQNWRWPSFTPEESRSIVGTVNFSSGTTGLPKGVAVTHSNLIHNTVQLSQVFNLREAQQEKWISFLPLYHAYGQCYAVLIATKNNIPIWIMRSFNLPRYLTLIRQHRITRLQVVPPILLMLDKRFEAVGADLSSVREILSGGAPLSKELQQTIETRFKVRITQGWGMSEATCAISAVPWNYQPVDGSVGLLLADTEMKLVDEDDKELGYNQRGEALIRGPQIAQGYWKNQQATDGVLTNGWLRTGDVATVDDAGNIRIVDRKKELIKVRGLQVSPAELESLLIENPEIEDAAVVGITLGDKEWPRAYIKKRPDSRLSKEQILNWMKPKTARHKWLEGGIAFVDDIPKLASGKIERKAVRKWGQMDALTIACNPQSRI